THNRDMQQVQFGDEHGHRWHFVRVYKRDRYGRLLDGNDKVVPDSDPERFQRAVHLKDIHLEKGMQCIDCHGAGDSHGDGKLYSQMRETIEIRCWDCHGTATTRPTLKTSGPTGGRDLTKEQTPFGKPRMERRGGKVVQNQALDSGDARTRAYTDYFPQLLRTDNNMMGLSGVREGHKFSAFRPANPVFVSVYDRGRNIAVHEQPTVSSPGYSGFAFTPN